MYVEKHAELATHFSIEIYGNVSNEVIEKINSLEIPLKHFTTTSVGYIRSERFAKVTSLKNVINSMKISEFFNLERAAQQQIETNKIFSNIFEFSFVKIMQIFYSENLQKHL